MNMISNMQIYAQIPQKCLQNPIRPCQTIRKPALDLTMTSHLSALMLASMMLKNMWKYCCRLFKSDRDKSESHLHNGLKS